MSRTNKKALVASLLSVVAAAVFAASPGALYAKGKPDKPGDGGGSSGTPYAPIIYDWSGGIFVTDGDTTTQVTSEGGLPTWTASDSPLGSGFLYDGKPGIYFQAFDDENGVALGAPDLIRNTGEIPELSPVPIDGKYKILFSEGSGTPDLFVMNTDGNNIQPVATGAWWGTWSPDGKQILANVTDSNGKFFLEIINVAFDPFQVTGTKILLAGDDFNLYGSFVDSDWSPDGSTIVISAPDATGSMHIYLVPVDNPKGLSNLTGDLEGDHVLPTFSWDGSQVLFSYRGPKPSCGGDKLEVSRGGKAKRIGGLVKVNVDGTMINGCPIESVSGGAFSDWRKPPESSAVPSAQQEEPASASPFPFRFTR